MITVKTTLLALGLGLILPSAQAADAETPPDLIENMMQMQYFVHKLSLSIDARNDKLSDFYAHEVEETIEAAETIPSYHDKPIGDLVTGMLVPAFERLEQAIETGDWKQSDTRLDDLIEACNACHTATGYEAIRIRRVENNPFMQSFQPEP